MKKQFWGVIQKNDVKSINWKLASADDVNFHILRRSQIFDPLSLVSCMFVRRSIPDFFIFRYLNDYSSLPKTLTRLCSELITLCICKLLNISVYWICHNVDKESIVSYPVITKIRRYMIVRASMVIFVTNSMLIPSAKKIFKNKHVRSISFGLVNKSTLPDKNTESWISSQLPNSKVKILITGAPVEKSMHFDYVEALILKCRLQKISISILIAGEFDNDDRALSLVQTYIKYPEIVLCKSYINISDKFINDNFNFYFRAYSDLSVPYTLYESCTLAIPMLTIEGCFLADIVEKYEIGFSLSSDFSNLSSVINKNVNSINYMTFLDKNNWRSLSQELLMSLRKYE